MCISLEVIIFLQLLSISSLNHRFSKVSKLKLIEVDYLNSIVSISFLELVLRASCVPSSWIVRRMSVAQSRNAVKRWARRATFIHAGDLLRSRIPPHPTCYFIYKNIKCYSYFRIGLINICFCAQSNNVQRNSVFRFLCKEIFLIFS